MPISKEGRRLISFTDVAPSSFSRMGSQIVFVLRFTDGKGNGNTLLDGRQRSKRATRTVIEAQHLGTITGFEHGLII